MESKNSTTSKTITLKSSDGAEFVVPEAAAMQSQLIRRMIEDDRSKKVIPLAEVNAQVLGKLIDYCKHQAVAGDKPETRADGEGSSVPPTTSKKPEEEQSDWDVIKFILDVPVDIYDDFCGAVQYLEINGLLHLIDENSEDTVKGESIWKFGQTISFDVLSKAIFDEEEIARYEEQIGATPVSVSGSDKISASNGDRMEDSKANTMIRLKSEDGEQFEIPEAVAMQAKTLRHMIEDDCTEGFIPLYNVSGKILAKVIEYCKRLVDESSNTISDTEKKVWEEKFLDIDQNTLFDLIMAANYLDIKALLDLMCLAVANMIKGKSPEEIRKTFHIKNDFTPEEEAAIREENSWAFE